MLEKNPHFHFMSPKPTLTASDILRRQGGENDLDDGDQSDPRKLFMLANKRQQQQDVEVELALLQQERLMEREKDEQLTKAEMAELAELRARNILKSFQKQQSSTPRKWDSNVHHTLVPTAPPDVKDLIPQGMIQNGTLYTPKMYRRVPIQ